MTHDTDEKKGGMPGTDMPRVTAGAGASQNRGEGRAAHPSRDPGNDALGWMKDRDLRQDGGNSAGDAGTSPAMTQRKKRVQRKTWLRGQSIDPPRYTKQAVRKQTGRDFEENDPDIPYIAWEKAMKDLICSLLERQDRLTRNFLLRGEIWSTGSKILRVKWMNILTRRKKRQGRWQDE